MIKIFRLLLLINLVVLLKPEAKSQHLTNEKVIEAVIEEFNEAMIHRDQDALDRLVSDELNYGHSSGLVQNKNEFIDGVVNGSFHFQTIHVFDQSMQFVDDIALVRHVFDFEFKNGQEFGHMQIGNFLIWRKTKRKWKLLARQAFKIN